MTNEALLTTEAVLTGPAGKPSSWVADVSAPSKTSVRLSMERAVSRQSESTEMLRPDLRCTCSVEFRTESVEVTTDFVLLQEFANVQSAMARTNVVIVRIPYILYSGVLLGGIERWACFGGIVFMAMDCGIGILRPELAKEREQ